MDVSLATHRKSEDSRDRELMRSALDDGDQDALTELYRLYSENVYLSCLRICRDPDDALDATQQAFCNVFKRIEKLDLSTLSFRDYLFVSSRNYCLNLISKRKRVELREELPEYHALPAPDASEDPVRAALISEQQKLVRKAGGQLSKRQYDALMLYEVDGLQYAQIGEKLGLEANAVAQLIMRARRSLRSAVRQRAATMSAGTRQCVEALPLLSRKVEGQLDGHKSEWLESHLSRCEICKTNLTLMEEVGARYRQILPPLALAWMVRDSFARVIKPEGTVEGDSRPAKTRQVRRLAVVTAASVGLLAAIPTVILASGYLGASWGGGQKRSTAELAREDRENAAAAAELAASLGASDWALEKGVRNLFPEGKRFLTPFSLTPFSSVTVAGLPVRPTVYRNGLGVEVKVLLPPGVQTKVVPSVDLETIRRTQPPQVKRGDVKVTPPTVVKPVVTRAPAKPVLPVSPQIEPSAPALPQPPESKGDVPSRSGSVREVRTRPTL